MHTILQDESFDRFTVAKLRDHYLSMVGRQKSASSAYSHVYRQLCKLEKNGVLKRHKKAQDKADLYEKTDKFNQTDFHLTAKKTIQNKPSTGAQNNSVFAANSMLTERLKQSEIDLLASIGESEEYMRLYKTFPEMKELLESQYLIARENSSKLLGQIKALKSVLKYQEK